METCIAHLPVSTQRLDEYRRAQNSDPVCSLVSKHCRNGWPGKQCVDEVMKPYWEVRGEVSMHDNLLLFGSRMQQETLRKLHQGHLGIQRCHLQASISVWWPGLSTQIEDLVKRCPECVKDATPPKEPLMPTELTAYPWQKVGSDLFVLKGALLWSTTSRDFRKPSS